MSIEYPNPADAIGVLLGIAASTPEVAAFGFASIDFAPLLEVRCPLTAADSFAVARALEHRATLHLPFWDGVMLAASWGDSIPPGALKAAAYHQTLENKIEWVDRNELNILKLRRMSQKACIKNQLLTVTSSVQMQDGSVKHIPLIDFHVEYSEHATSLIAEVIPLLGVSGSLLRSGKSYHFYGEALLTGGELTRFLGKALLFAPIVDRAWIAHQLIESRCALRISPRPEYGGVPVFVRRV
jgi:hypothetical protein